MTRADVGGAVLPRGFTGLDRRRVWGAVALLVVGLGVLVLARGPVRGLDYAVPVLLVLLLVVASALLGGLRVALPGAVAGALVLNWFFTPPFGTLIVDSPEQVLVLVVFVLVAVGVSSVVDVAARRNAEAMRARAEAEALSRLAGATVAEHRTLTDVLDQVREVFGMREAALVERVDGRWTEVEARSDQPPADDEAELTVPSGGDLMLRVRGPELFAADRRVLASFADAAAGALQGRRVAARAAEAAELEAADRMRTSLLAGVGHDLRTPLASVKAAVGSLRQEDVAWTPDERAELLATIETGTDRLQGLVANLLDASRLQAGAVSTALERVRLEELVGRALIGSAASTASSWTSRRTSPTSSPTPAWPSGCWPTCSRTPCGTAGRVRSPSAAVPRTVARSSARSSTTAPECPCRSGRPCSCRSPGAAGPAPGRSVTAARGVSGSGSPSRTASRRRWAPGSSPRRRPAAA